MATHGKLKMRRDGAQAWLLFDRMSGADVGGVRYEHAADGNHYRPWVFVDGRPRDLPEPLPQLAMAARSVEDAAAGTGPPTT